MSASTDIKPAAPTVVFPAHALAFVAPFRATSDIRYYLCGIAVEPHPDGGVIVAATNGHQMALAYCEHGRTDQRRILRVTPALVAAAKRGRAAFVGLQGDRVKVISNPPGIELKEWSDLPGLESFVQGGDPLVDGRFPIIGRVIPRASDDLRRGLHGCVAARYLETIAKAALFIGGPKFSGCEHWSKGDGSLVLTRFPTEPNYLLLTMTMRGDGAAMEPLPLFADALHTEGDERERKAQALKDAAEEAKAAALVTLKSAPGVPA